MADSSFLVELDGKEYKAKAGQTILDVAREQDVFIPGICYHPNLGTIQTCDTCYVSVNGELVRACATKIKPGMKVDTASELVKISQNEAMDPILKNHELYCTVCDNNNGNCTVHNTVEKMRIEHQKYPFRAKPYPPDNSHPFYRYEPDQCIFCGRCVEACQDLQVNETLTFRVPSSRTIRYGFRGLKPGIYPFFKRRTTRKKFKLLEITEKALESSYTCCNH